MCEKVPSHEFLRKYQARFYLNEVIALLIENRPERPLEFIAEYFEGVLSGSNIINKNFKYINSTARNRLAFMDLFECVYSKISDDQRMNHDELFQLIVLLFPDFSEYLTLQVYKTLILSDPENQSKREWMERVASDTTPIDIKQQQTYELPKFSSFRLALRTYLFYNEFFDMIFTEVFQKNFLLSLPITNIEQKIVNLCREMTTIPFNSSPTESTKTSYLCVPSTKKMQKVLHGLQASQDDEQINFSFFCAAFYREIINNKNDIICMMDDDATPINSLNAQKQHSRMRKYMSKLNAANDKKNGSKTQEELANSELLTKKK